MLDFQAARWTMKHEVPPQAGNNHPTSIPTGVFQTTDGHINLAAAGDHMFVRLCEALGADELKKDAHYQDGAGRLEHRDELNDKLQVYFATNSSAHWVELLNKAGVPCGPIYAMDEVFADPQVKHLGMATKVHHPDIGDFEIVRNAINLSNDPNEPYTATPERGEHTDQVLGEFGYSAEQIEALRADEVI
ncbi:MAG: CoA transferase, partial [Gammaproteobacteria bacterium]|nr:CoA transferase [Gammaproteobacteria bacterium]